MRHTYCCDTRAYEHYYLNQVGRGGTYFSGSRYQSGYGGLSGIFNAISKTVMPLLKSGAKAIGKQALKSGVGFASDVLQGKNMKQAAIDRAKAAGSNLLQRAVKRKNPPRVQKRKRRRKKDIFS